MKFSQENFCGALCLKYLMWLKTIVVWLPIKPIKDTAVSQLLATN